MCQEMRVLSQSECFQKLHHVACCCWLECAEDLSFVFVEVGQNLELQVVELKLFVACSSALMTA